jgi:amidase
MVITDWKVAVQKANELRESTLKRVPNYIRDEDLPSSVGHNVLDVPKKVLTPREIEITEGYDATALVAALQTGKLTSTEVVKAFLRRATLASKLVNCVTEFLADEALERAADLDAYFKKHGKPVGPLHGLPISVKDHIGMKGKVQSVGFCSLMDQTAENDADILVILRNLGAVFHVRTPMPQALFSIDTSSPLWGNTVTPYNRNLSAGGSSGGEGALIGMRGSVLGLGKLVDRCLFCHIGH